MFKIFALFAALCSVVPTFGTAYAAPRLALEAVDSSGHKISNVCSPGAKLGDHIGTLTNTGDAPLVISSIRLEGGQLEDFAFDWDMGAGVRSLVSASDPLTLYPEGSTLGLTSYSIRVNCSPLSTLSGTIATDVLIDSNDPDFPQVTVSVTADVVARPRIAIISHRARLVTGRNKKGKDLVVVATMANVSPTATTRVVELGLEGQMKNKNFKLRTQSASVLASGETAEVSIRLKGLPFKARRVSRGVFMEALLSAELRVDPRKKILEGNEQENGDAYDLEFTYDRTIPLSVLSR
jgi:hypothetical protein